MTRASAFTRPGDGFLQTRPVDRRIAEIAARQHGVVGRGQLLALGLREDAIDGRLRRGSLHRVHAGVYAVGHDDLRQLGRWMAAVLASGAAAVLSHRSAAALWGVRPVGAMIEVTAPRKTRSTASIRRHRSLLPADEITTYEGVPVTTVPRTIFDLAATEAAHVPEAALREAEYLRLDDRLSLPRLLERYPCRAGSRTIRACLARRRETVGHSRSWLEEVFLPFLDEHRLVRPPRINAWVQVGERRFQVDCLWPQIKAIVELDGFASHGTRSAFGEDRARDRRLRTAGYTVTRVAPEQIRDEPADLADDLRILLGARA